MNVYILVREDYNDNATVEKVFSSKKKANSHLNDLVTSLFNEGWKIYHGAFDFVHKTGKVPYVEFHDRLRNRKNVERRYILKEKVE